MNATISPDPYALLFAHVTSTLGDLPSRKKRDLLRALFHILGTDHPCKAQVGEMINLITRTEDATQALSEEFQKLLKGDR